VVHHLFRAFYQPPHLLVPLQSQAGVLVGSLAKVGRQFDRMIGQCPSSAEESWHPFVGANSLNFKPFVGFYNFYEIFI
jgi:hypothetical protein